MKERKQLPARNVSSLLWLLLLTLVLISCGRKDTSANEEEPTVLVPGHYKENDSLEISPLPENLATWFKYYKQLDTTFRPGNFLASGVSIHLDSLENATTGDLSLMEDFYPLFAISPDSSQIIDFWSYNQLIEKNKSGELIVIGGDPDQEVVWINKNTGSKKQLMYNGPQQIVETADWITNQSFVLSLINIDEKNTLWVPEIYLFNLTDTTFTNFRYNQTILAEKMALKGADFSSFWLKTKKYKRA